MLKTCRWVDVTKQPPELLSSTPVFKRVRVAWSLFLCVVFFRSLFAPMFLFFDLRILIWLSLIWSHSSFINTTVSIYIFCLGYIIACSRGTYGLNCRKRCSSNCKHQTCNPVSGKCNDGCIPGRKGGKCNQGIKFCMQYINVTYSIQDTEQKQKRSLKIHTNN